MPGKAGDQKLAADCIGRLAIHAGAGLGTRRRKAKALSIGWSCYVSGSLHRAVKIRADLVHAYDKKNVFRSLRYRRNPVGIAIDVDQNSVVSHGVGTGNKIVSIVRIKHGFSFILFASLETCWYLRKLKKNLVKISV